MAGIVIVLGIALAVVLLAVAGYMLVARFGRTRPHVQERRPQRPGRVGRISKQHGP